MIEALAKALNVVILIFLVSAMLGCGLSLKPKQIVAPFRSVRLGISSAIVSYLLVPLIAVMTSTIIGLEEPLKIGLVIFSMAAGAEAGPKFVGIAKGNVGFSVGLLAAQLCVTIIYVPLILSMLLPEVHFDHLKLLLKLCATVALPIGVGLFLKARHERIADRLNPYVHKISSVFMLLMALLIIVVNHEGLYGLLTSGAMLAAPIFIIASFITGYLFGGPDLGTRQALAIMSGARNASISLMIVSQVFNDPKITMMIVLTVVLMLFMLFPVVRWLGRRAETTVSAVTH